MNIENYEDDLRKQIIKKIVKKSAAGRAEFESLQNGTQRASHRPMMMDEINLAPIMIDPEIKIIRSMTKNYYLK